MLRLLRVEPLHDAVDVEAVGACAPHQGAVVAGQLAVWAASVEGHTADAARVVVGNPLPRGDPVPATDVNVQLKTTQHFIVISTRQFLPRKILIEAVGIGSESRQNLRNLQEQEVLAETTK